MWGLFFIRVSKYDSNMAAIERLPIKLKYLIIDLQIFRELISPFSKFSTSLKKYDTTFFVHTIIVYFKIFSNL